MNVNRSKNLFHQWKSGMAPPAIWPERSETFRKPKVPSNTFAITARGPSSHNTTISVCFSSEAAQAASRIFHIGACDRALDMAGPEFETGPYIYNNWGLAGCHSFRQLHPDAFKRSSQPSAFTHFFTFSTLAGILPSIPTHILLKMKELPMKSLVARII